MADSNSVKNEEINRLYSSVDLRIMQMAQEAELAEASRVEEIIRYAKAGGISRIGIAHCFTLKREVEILKEKLSSFFEVFSVTCKCGRIPAETILGEGARGVSCNPAGQAEHLAKENTELNILIGLCMGHDLIFIEKSKAPVTTLVVKDRKHNHNPIKELRD